MFFLTRKRKEVVNLDGWGLGGDSGRGNHDHKLLYKIFIINKKK